MKLISSKPLAVSAAATAALTLAAFANFTPRFVWNGSESAAIGLYVIVEKPVRIGDFALVDPPADVKSFIETRGYLPTDTPLIKRVAAAGGDEICRDGARILINDVFVARALGADSAGRPMPEWRGCFTLRPDEVFLLNDHQKSLDGRYFGATKRADILGAARPVWTRKSQAEAFNKLTME